MTKKKLKKIKELFASTLNGITASVKCVSSIIAVLNARFTRLIAAHVNKKSRQECRFFLVETHKHLTFIAVLTVQAKTSLLYTFQRSMQANRNIIYGRKNHPFTGYPAVKHPKHSKLASDQ